MTKKAWIFGVPGKQMLSNFFSSERRKRLSLRKRFASLRCRLRQQRPMFFLAPQSHLSTTGSDALPGTSSRQDWTCFWCGRWALSRNQVQPMDLNARFDGHSHGSVVSIPAVQFFPSNETPVFVEGWSRNIGAEGILSNQASNGLESFGIHLQWECFEFAKARTGSPFGTAVQIQKGANEDQTLKSLEFVSQSLYICLKEPRREIKRLLVKRATVRVSTCVRHSCMHLQGALRLSIWSICENVQTSFTWSKISRSSLQNAGMQQAAQIVSSRPVVSKHTLERQCVIDTRLAAFNLLVAALHFQMTDCSIEDLEVKSRWARTTTLCLPVIWWIYPARGCVV